MKEHNANLFMSMCCKFNYCVFSHRHIKRFALTILFILSYNISSLLAITIETQDSLVDEDRVLTEPIELHLTSADNPFTNSSVSLNHEDAWLFFDNIKPCCIR